MLSSRTTLPAWCCASLALLWVVLSVTAHGAEVGAPAPLFEGPQRDGTPLSLTSLRGDVVYVDFWAAWCAPCRRAIPALDALYESLSDQGFTVVGINVDRHRSDAVKLLDELQPSFPMVFDPQGEWAEAYALPGMPSGYLIDRQGIVRYRHVGYRESDLPALEQHIKTLVNES